MSSYLNFFPKNLYNSTYMQKNEGGSSLTLEILNNFNIEQFQNDLIGWFEEEQRDLPWRKNKDPYRVWVSEIMLQQTRVEAVKPYYANFMGKFPTLEALANADDEEVLKSMGRFRILF